MDRSFWKLPRWELGLAYRVSVFADRSARSDFPFTSSRNMCSIPLEESVKIEKVQSKVLCLFSLYSLMLFKENVNFQIQIKIMTDFSKIAADMKMSTVQFWLLQSPGSLRRQKGEKFRTSGRLPLLGPFNSLVVCCFPCMKLTQTFCMSTCNFSA